MPPVKKAKQAKATKQPLVTAEVKSPVISGQLEKKIKKKNNLVKNERGVIFIKHLPHGFFEDQMKKYFQQFGTVTRLRLARSKRTGGSKGFAFVEFEYPEVAQVAAETMDNYLMFQRVVKAQYIPPEHQKFNYFKTSLRKVKNKAGKDIYVSGKTLAIQRKVKEHNDWSDIAYQKRTEVKLNKVKKLQKKYEHLGIDFSSILVQPNQVTNVVDEKAAVVESDSTEKNSNSKKKRKNEISETTSKQKIEKKSKKDVELEDLLGNTIAEDSEDEDWIDSKNDNDDSSSDEESYGFIKDADDNSKGDNNIGEDSDGDEDEEEIAPKKFNKKTKPTYEKNTKASKVDRFDQLIKRKPHTGGIQKLKNKVANKQSITENKKSMQAIAIKDLTKTKAVSKKKPNKNAKGGRKQQA